LKKITFIVNHISHLYTLYRLSIGALGDLYQIDFIVLEDLSLFKKRGPVRKFIAEHKLPLLIYVDKSFIPFYGRNIFLQVLRCHLLKIRLFFTKASIDHVICMGPSSLSVYSAMNYCRNIIVLEYSGDSKHKGNPGLLGKLNMIAMIINFLSKNPKVKIYEKQSAVMPISLYEYSMEYKKISIEKNAWEGKIEASKVYLPTKKYSNAKFCGLLIIGSAYLSWKISKDEKSKINMLYKKIIDSRENNEDVFYIPHPLENGIELKILKNSVDTEIKLLNNEISTDFFLLDSGKRLLCISVGSLALLTAIELGHLAKSFYKLIEFDEMTRNTYDCAFERFDNSFFLDANISNLYADYVTEPREEYVEPIIMELEDKEIG
jgi:hypothetical protein